MALQGKEADNLYLPLVGVSLLLLAACLYWHSYGLWLQLGLTSPVIDNYLLSLGGARLMGEYTLKSMIFILVFSFSIIRIGMTTNASWTSIILMLVFGGALFFLPWFNAALFVVTTVAGYLLLISGFILLGRKTAGVQAANNDKRETFEQCERKIETDYTVNIPMKYFYRGRFHKGWINVFPFMGVAIMGLPGTGKSYAIYYNFFDQMMAKGFAFFVYDYKFPDLTKLAYNKWLQYYPGEWRNVEKSHMDGTTYTEREYFPPKGAPQFCILNMDDPLTSMRCNPLSTRYLREKADCQEVATVVFDSLQGRDKGGGGNSQFFRLSGIAFIAAQLEFLRIYHGGVYCSFPHLIEMMTHDYEEVFGLLKEEPSIETMISPFARALENNVMEQLQGQIDSAMIPMIQFAVDSIYWVLTSDPNMGDDFTLDINDPDNPKVVCVGNNPDRQSIYGTTLTLYTTRLFKVINHKLSRSGKPNRMSAIMVDELPTQYLDKLDGVIATARANGVATIIGFQDKTQLERDYNKENAAVIMNTVGNLISGRVNFETAHMMSSIFGKEFRMQQSHTTGSNSDSISTSWQQQEILPESQIMNLSQGYFCGKTADEADNENDRKAFCAKIDIDKKARGAEEKAWLPIPRVGAKYFDDEEIRYQINLEPEKHCKRYLKEKITREEQMGAWRDPHYTRYSETSIDRLVDAKWEALMSDKKGMQSLIDETVSVRQDESHARKVSEHAKLIKSQINGIFEEYRFRHKDDDPAAGGPAVKTRRKDETAGADSPWAEPEFAGNDYQEIFDELS